MMNHRALSNWRIPALRTGMLLLLCALIAACTPPPGTAEPKDRFPLKADMATFTVGLGFRPVGDTALSADESTFRKFIKEYLRRGRSALTVAMTPSANEADARAVVARLRAEGIRRSAIVLEPGKAPATESVGAMLSFRGYMITVPECGNWQGESGFNPTNLSHTNYGCAYYRNLGLMLSDPGDLVAPSGVVEADARRMDQIIRVFREGTAAGADPPKGEKGKFASPTQEQ